jgi:hypothetical protein
VTIAAATVKPKRPAKTPPLVRYGVAWPDPDPVRIELACIARGGSWLDSHKRTCGAGTAHHVQSVARVLWPWFRWHRWASDLILPQLCQPRTRGAIWGPSNSGKSALTALVYLVFYFARPDRTTVLLSSTTRDELDLRIWGEVKRLWVEAREIAPWLPGHLTDSKQLITTDGKEVEGRDFRNGIIGRPCRKGNEWVGLGPMVGIKNEYMFVAGDELHLMPEGFLKSMANLTANPNCSFVGLGNLNDLSTPLGEAAEPANGWDALGDSDVSRVYPTRWLNGWAVQLIGRDSPQLDFPEGHEPFGPLIGRRYLAQCEHDYGLDTPLYNMFAAGKIPRGTLENRVITKAVCLRHGAFEPVEWGHERLTRIYCADLSYTASHGDRTVGIPIDFGHDVEGRLRLAPLERPLVYTPSDRASGTIEEQLAFQMRAECARLNIPPEHVFYDGTGRSSFTVSKFTRGGSFQSPGWRWRSCGGP